jgi:hypothetical protein
MPTTATPPPSHDARAGRWLGALLPLTLVLAVTPTADSGVLTPEPFDLAALAYLRG